MMRCDDCGHARTDVRTVLLVEQGSGPGGGRSACTECVPFGRGILDGEADR